MKGWKVVTHDLRPPVQGGDPIWSGETPCLLPKVPLDTSKASCSFGWNFCESPSAALRIAGLWPDGHPSRLFVVESVRGHRVVADEGKRRTSRLRVVREATDTELHDALVALHAPIASHHPGVVGSVEAWREALGRPGRDEVGVETGLRVALDVRELSGWRLRRFDTARAARVAWDAWAARDAQAAWDARVAWAALTVEVAAIAGWTDHDPMLLTAGIKDAYRAGLAVAVPVEAGVLGWAMEDDQ